MPYSGVNEATEPTFNEVMEALTNQNERLQQFSHIVSHNLRSHAGNLELMLKMFRESSDVKEKELFLSQIEKISGSLSETIQNLSEVIKIHNRSPEGNLEVRISTVVQKALYSLHADIGNAGGHIQIGLTEWDILHCEPAYIDSIVHNLLCNAIKYRHAAREPEIRIDTLLSNGKKQLKISDNGLGIDLALYGDKLFGMYKTFHKNKDARGIGLFITKSQIEAMGGKIWAESTPDVGTQFTVEFATDDCSSDRLP